MMSKEYETMGQTPVAGDDKYRYIVEGTGEKFWDKPEHMTQLKGNILVSKNHPRIYFRGQLDYLQAKVLELQAEAKRKNLTTLDSNLGDILDRCRKIMTTEAIEVPLEDGTLFGLDEKELRARSHNPKKYFGVDHPYANAEMDEISLKLNTLRTEVRKAELAGIEAHQEQNEDWQVAILREMNRLSSAVYILYCQHVGEELGIK